MNKLRKVEIFETIDKYGALVYLVNFYEEEFGRTIYEDGFGRTIDDLRSSYTLLSLEQAKRLSEVLLHQGEKVLLSTSLKEIL